jgi:hypothetical protein
MLIMMLLLFLLLLLIASSVALRIELTINAGVLRWTGKQN